MGVICTSENRTLSVALTGEVDHHGARGMMTTLEREIDRVLPKKLTIDLGGVTFMDSSGIAVLLRAYRKMGQLGGTVAVQNIPGQARRMLKAAGIDKIIPFEP